MCERSSAEWQSPRSVPELQSAVREMRGRGTLVVSAPEGPALGTKMVKKFINVGALVSLLISSMAAPAAAQHEQMLFPATDDASAAIISKINSETVRVDVAVWYLQDRGITNALINKFKSGVPVRVIGDWLPLFVIDPTGTRAEFELLANAGIPIRLRYHPTWFPEAMHWKCGIFVGQHTVEFGSANWTPFELTPWSSTDFKDETAFFTNDTAIVNGFLSQFDTMWRDTTYFLDFPEVYKLQTGNTWPKPMNISRERLEADHPPPPGMIWGQGPGLNGAMATEIDKEQNGIDLLVYRLSDPVITDAAIRRLKAGVPVRVIVEPTQYRQPDWPEYWLTGAQIDRLWVNGAQIKIRQHQGLMHMKSMITSSVALNGSSNFTRNWQRDHNYFISAATKPAIYLAMKDRFNAMWNDNVNYIPFTPLRPEAVTLVGPAQNTTGISTTPTFEWKRSRWATSFDVYLGIAGGAMTFQARVNAQLTEDPPQTYTWTPSVPLQTGTTYQWRVVSRTIATDVNAGLIDSSDTFTFTTGGATAGPAASSLPGTIQAEDFDAGPSGTAYFDNSPGNNGGVYRNTDVDIAAAQDTGGGYTLGWVGAGEWLRYTVNVATAGTYDIEVRVASDGTGGRFHIEVDNVNKTGDMIVPNTGGWQTWVTIKKTGVALAAGTQTWLLKMDANGPGGAVGNFNWFRVVAAGSTPPPPPPTEVCGNGIDDDGDGLIDEGCTPTPPPAEVCGNGIDDDRDGLIDEGCAPPPPAAPEIVIHTASVPTANLKGNWARVNDASAASGAKVASADLTPPGTGTVAAPLAAPVNYFDVTFTAQAGVRYRLWLRMSAAGNSKWNDSVYVQFSGSVDAGGAPRYRIGTTAGLNVNQATCGSCPPTGWGWQNRGYWEPDTGEIWFATTGTQTIRIQIREDGVAIDQIVLSPVTYVNTPPGPATNDSTIVPKS